MTKKSLFIALIIASMLFSPDSCLSYTSESIPYTIKSPEDLAAWLHDEFSYEFKFPDARQMPDETLRTRKGDCEDLALLSQLALKGLGIKSDVMVIKFRQIGIMHAICIFKKGQTYSFMSNREMVRTRGRTLTEAITENFPDWDKIIYMSENGELGHVVDRGYSIDIAANNISLASLYGDLLGVEHKDMGMIRMVLQEQLMAFTRTLMPVNIGTFMTILKERSFGYSSQNSIKFLFNDLELTSCGFRVLCRAEDPKGARYYHAIFSINRNESGGFSVAVYSDKEWQRVKGYKGIMPHEDLGSGAAALKTQSETPVENAFPPVDIHPM